MGGERVREGSQKGSSVGLAEVQDLVTGGGLVLV